MATEKRKIHRVVDREGTLIQVLPETSAEQVTLADAGNKFTSTNVEGALAEVAQDIAALETGLANAGKVDDVRNNASDASTSIVTNKIADLSKAVVKEAGKVTNKLSISAHNGSTSNKTVTFDGSVGSAVDFDVNSFEYSSTDNGMKVSLVDKGYATKTYVDTQDNKKLDKTGGTVTGALAVNGGLTVGGNLTVNGTTTTVDSTTLQVKDKLIEVAHGNTTKLTTPAGLVAPKYDGTNSGALVFDSDGIASVGDVELDASGNIDVARSQLQPLATRTGLVNDHLVKYDSAKQTLVDSEKTISDFATAAQGSNADSALSKANANATEIANIKNGTNGTKVKYAEHADTADSATSAGSATSATTAKNVSETINNHAISYIFEDDGVTAKWATHATAASSVEGSLYIGYGYNKQRVEYTGSSGVDLKFSSDDFNIAIDNNPSGIGLGFSEEVSLKDTGVKPTGVTVEQYSAVKVDAKGRVTAGGQSIEWGTSGQTTPSGDLMIGGLFMELQ